MTSEQVAASLRRQSQQKAGISVFLFVLSVLTIKLKHHRSLLILSEDSLLLSQGTFCELG